MGVLVKIEATSNLHWPFQLVAKTFSHLNFDVYGYVSNNFTVEQLIAQIEILEINHRHFEVGLALVQQDQQVVAPPYFLFAKEITSEINFLNQSLADVFFEGMIDFIISLIVLFAILWRLLTRIQQFSGALPLLASHHFDEFRNKLAKNRPYFKSVDEIDQLHATVLDLANQMEVLDRTVHENTLQILEKSQELVSERDFVHNLLNVIPVIVTTQKMNGQIVSINQAGLDFFEKEGPAVGQLFDLYAGSGNRKHLEKLALLRSGQMKPPVYAESLMMSADKQVRKIFWTHSLIHDLDAENQPIILSIGIVKARAYASKNNTVYS